MNADTPANVVEISQAPTKAERRRAARQAAAEAEQTNPEAVPAEPETENEDEPKAAAIADVVRDYGHVVADLARDRKIPHAQGVRIVELVLQYDVQRRNLALQEASLMQNQFRNFIPDGATPVTPEEAEQLEDGTHPALQEE